MKRLLSLMLALIMTTSVFAMTVSAEDVKLISAKPDAEITFSDVEKDTAEGKAIYKLVNAGVLQGDGNGKFRPDDPISRAELSKIVNIIFKYTEKDETGFKDVTPNLWYHDYVLVAKKAGYIVGYDDGTFKGDNHVTREQACAILCRVANLSEVGVTFDIKDAVSDWALTYVQKALGNLFVFLEDGNTFRAQQDITREEFSVIFAKFVEEPKEEKPEKPSGGSIGGGNNRPDDEEEEEIDIEIVNQEMLTNLKKVSKDIEDNMLFFTMEESAMMIYIVKECIDKVIADGSSHVIDRDYLSATYGDDIDEAQAYFNIIKDDPEKKAKFQDEAGYLRVGTIQWLLEAFNIDTSELMN